MKLIFLGASFRIIWFMRFHKAVKRTYNKEQDTFRMEFLVGPCILLALIIHRSFAVIEVRFEGCGGSSASGWGEGEGILCARLWSQQKHLCWKWTCFAGQCFSNTSRLYSAQGPCTAELTLDLAVWCS